MFTAVSRLWNQLVGRVGLEQGLITNLWKDESRQPTKTF